MPGARKGRALRYGEIESRSREVAVGNQTFTVATTVLDDTPGNNMKEITVDVSWPQPGGRQNVQLKTVYTEVRR